MARFYEDLGVPYGHEKLTTATAVGFTAAKILPTSGNFIGRRAKAAIISVETEDMRFTLDGTTPVVTGASQAGHLLPKGSSYEIKGEQSVATFKCINAVASNGAIVMCTFFF